LHVVVVSIPYLFQEKLFQ